MCVCVRDAFLCTYVLDGEQVFFVFILFFFIKLECEICFCFPFFYFISLICLILIFPFYIIPFFSFLCEWFAIHDSIPFLRRDTTLLLMTLARRA